MELRAYGHIRYLTINTVMHVEFKLPSGAGGQAAHYSCTVLRSELTRWCDLHGISYTTEVTYYKLTVRFGEEQDYTLFGLCWPVAQIRWQILED